MNRKLKAAAAAVGAAVLSLGAYAWYALSPVSFKGKPPKNWPACTFPYSAPQTVTRDKDGMYRMTIPTNALNPPCYVDIKVVATDDTGLTATDQRRYYIQ